jgi:predicted transcriptional regulator
LPTSQQKAKRRGRPVTIGVRTVTSIKMAPAMAEAVDSYAKAAGVTRSEAARRLIEAGLKRRPKAPTAARPPG